MKKNWFVISLLLGFIVLWQTFVLKPYQQEQLKKVPTTPSASSTATPNTGASTPVTSAPGAASGITSDLPYSAPGLAVARDLTTASRVDFPGQRSFYVFPDTSLGHATFGTYFVRGHEPREPVVLLKENFAWTSSDAKVQECLKALQNSGNLTTSTLSIEKTMPTGGYCRIRIAPDTAHPGLSHLELSLRGFSADKASVEFKATDKIGTGIVQDHNYLGYKVDGSRKWIREKELFKAKRIEGKMDWLAWGDKYFIVALLPKGAYNPNTIYGPAGSDDKERVLFGFQYPLFPAVQQNLVTYELALHFGTRDTDELMAVDPRLSDAVDLGTFSIVAKAMIFALNKLNIVFHNFGLSIIALTILVRLCFWPLNRKVYQSSLRMKGLQPEIEKIRAKYGNDKTKADQMNRELLGLYKVHKVNPAGSCLPLLAQLPIFIGLYAALGHSLDLYQAPFMGWIHDLSSKDPFYVFPTLWTLSLMYLQVLNPQTPQPGQPDMKWFLLGMNVLFGFFSKDWPAGLTLYLFVSNLVGIVQQVMLKRDAKLQPVQEGV